MNSTDLVNTTITHVWRILEGLSRAPHELSQIPQYMAIAYVAILIMAIVPLWLGAHLSLTKASTETMTSKDAYMFPLIGSCVLFGLYIIFKLLNPELINLALSVYFLILGVIATAQTVSPLFSVFFPSSFKENVHSLKFRPFWKKNEVINKKFNDVDLFGLGFALVLGIYYFATKNWIANDIIGISFSVQGIALLSIGAWKTGAILLSGLFLYDIFWVFGTDVMVSVAKAVDAPIKLLWPKDVIHSLFFSPTAPTLSDFTMLGLGDIVIPGLFIALLLRFDRHRSKNKKNFSKPYFFTNYIAYIAALFTTILVMHTFKAAQPALLYLVPFCLGASLLTSFVLGEPGKLINYTEDEKSKEKTGENKQKKKGAQKQKVADNKKSE